MKYTKFFVDVKSDEDMSFFVCNHDVFKKFALTSLTMSFQTKRISLVTDNYEGFCDYLLSEGVYDRIEEVNTLTGDNLFKLHCEDLHPLWLILQGAKETRL